MCRGLGSTEQRVLAVLRGRQEWTAVRALVPLVYDCVGRGPTEAERKACLRAIRSLERLGLVESQMVRGAGRPYKAVRRRARHTN